MPVVPETPEGHAVAPDIEAPMSLEIMGSEAEFHSVDLVLVVLGVDVDEETGVGRGREIQAGDDLGVEGDVGYVAFAAELAHPFRADLGERRAFIIAVEADAADQLFVDADKFDLDVIVVNTRAGRSSAAGAVGKDEVLEAVAALHAELIDVAGLRIVVNEEVDQTGGQIEVELESLPFAFFDRAGIFRSFAFLRAVAKIVALVEEVELRAVVLEVEDRPVAVGAGSGGSVVVGVQAEFAVVVAFVLETFEGDFQETTGLIVHLGIVDGDGYALLAFAYLGHFQDFVAVDGLDGRAVGADRAPLGVRGSDHAGLTEGSAFCAAFKILIEEHDGAVCQDDRSGQHYAKGKNFFHIVVLGKGYWFLLSIITGDIIPKRPFKFNAFSFSSPTLSERSNPERYSLRSCRKYPFRYKRDGRSPKELFHNSYTCRAF